MKSKSQKRSLYITLFLLTSFFLLGLFAPLISPYPPDQIHSNRLVLGPFWAENGNFKHPLGTDDLGRDILSRLIHGARVSMNMGVLVVLCSLFLGGCLGVLAGYLQRSVDQIISRMTDILMAIPSLLLAIVVVSILGPGIPATIVAVSLVALPSFIRVTRASIMEESSKLYVQALRSLGLSHSRILFKHILPNCLSPLIIQSTLCFSEGVLNIAALGFLGLGAQPPTPEWGAMLSDARSYIESHPWLLIFPGLCILSLVLCFNLLGDILRDKLDPKLSRS